MAALQKHFTSQMSIMQFSNLTVSLRHSKWKQCNTFWTPFKVFLTQGLFSEMELLEKMLTERKGFIFQNSKNNRIIHFNIYVVVKHFRGN